MKSTQAIGRLNDAWATRYPLYDIALPKPFVLSYGCDEFELGFSALGTRLFPDNFVAYHFVHTSGALAACRVLQSGRSGLGATEIA